MYSGMDGETTSPLALPCRAVPRESGRPQKALQKTYPTPPTRPRAYIAPRLLFLLRPRSKPDRPLLLRQRGHELADGIEYDLELSVVSLLQRRELAGEIDVSGEHLPQAHEGAHDFHVDQDGALAAQHAGEHGDPVR